MRRWMLAVTVGVFTNLALFLAVMPVQVAHVGGSRLEVGEATSFFSAGTVACELLVAVAGWPWRWWRRTGCG